MKKYIVVLSVILLIGCESGGIVHVSGEYTQEQINTVIRIIKDNKLI